MKIFFRALGVVSIIGISFSMAIGNTLAGGSGLNTAKYVYFRVDTELDVLAYYSTNGATVTWRCNGSNYGSVTDGSASDSDGIANGVIKVSSTSLEMGDAESGCDAGEALTATASFSGWVNRNFTSTTLTDTANFTDRASMDYRIVVSGITNELSTTLTLDGTTASATFAGTVASQSYSGGKKYIAATTNNTVTGGANGYVNSTSGTLTTSATASTSTSFSLSYGVKATLNGTTRNGQSVSNITGATVVAGDSGLVSCTGSGGSYYCAVPLAHTGTTATASNVSNGMVNNLTCSYTDRSTGSDAQSTCTISAVEPSSGVSGSSGGGGGGGGGGTSTVTPTPTPAPSDTPTPSATPTPGATATPTPSSNSQPSIPNATVVLSQVGLHEGEVIGASADDPDVYIANIFGYKRLFLNPIIFGFYGHLGGFTKVVKISTATRDVLPTSGLFRNCETNDQKIWAVQVTSEDGGTLHHVNMSGEAAVAQDPNFFKKVFCINTNEETWYSKSADAYTSLSQIPLYTRQ